MIPKIIHYCWFGGTPIPERDQKCLDSWAKYCPDYEIRRWDESNYDVMKNEYMKEAYEQRKWGFVPDFARLDIIYAHGGIYLDTDVELVRNLDDLLVNQAYMGFEEGGYISPGLGFGAEKGNALIGEICHSIYDKRLFVKEGGELDTTPSPWMNTELLIKKGLIQNGQFQMIEGMAIYPVEFFDPMHGIGGDTVITENTHSIHHYHASWMEAEERIALLRMNRLKKRLGSKNGERIGTIVNLPIRIKMRVRINGIGQTIRFGVKKLRWKK